MKIFFLAFSLIFSIFMTSCEQKGGNVNSSGGKFVYKETIYPEGMTPPTGANTNSNAKTNAMNSNTNTNSTTNTNAATNTNK